MAPHGLLPEPEAICGRCLVTGVAGFIGSHLAERLLDLGCSVSGMDSFTDYYPRQIKEANLARLRGRAGFEFHEEDVAEGRLSERLAGVDFVFHAAGQPGIRSSWGANFASYVHDNVLATQRLLDAALAAPGLRRFVYSSSSSIYGDSRLLPVPEAEIPRPVSPYGVTKLAGEHLCRLYATNFGLPTVSLRYFTVYGPRQRPDMAFSRFLDAIAEGGTISLNGDGEQTRDFTFVADAVEANVLAAITPRADPGSVYNIGGGSRVKLNRVLAELELLTGRKPVVERRGIQPGDVLHTWADTAAAARDLGFRPRVLLREGLRAQVEWAHLRRGAAVS